MKKPITQRDSAPKFMIYDVNTDQCVPLTGLRLQQLVENEKLLGDLQMALKGIKVNIIDPSRVANKYPLFKW